MEYECMKEVLRVVLEAITKLNFKLVIIVMRFGVTGDFTE